MANMVLVPGGTLGTWIWDEVANALDAHVVPMPFRDDAMARRTATWDDIIDAMAQELRAIGGPVTLVGHSLGGLVCSGVAAKHPDLVERIVYVGSLLPPTRRSFVSTFPLPARLIVGLLFRFNRAGMVPPEKMLRHDLCNGVPEPAANRVCAEPQTDAPASMRDAITWDYPSQPTTYLRLLQDKAVSLSAQDASIARLPGADVVEIDAGHLPMLAAPEKTAEALRSIASAP